MRGHAHWVTRREDVTAKQQLPLMLKVLLKTLLKAKPTVLPVPCRVTQGGCTAMEKSRAFAPMIALRSAQTDAAPFPAPGTAGTARSTGS
jgi:hypothetical protein